MPSFSSVFSSLRLPLMVRVPSFISTDMSSGLNPGASACRVKASADSTTSCRLVGGWVGCMRGRERTRGRRQGRQDAAVSVHVLERGPGCNRRPVWCLGLVGWLAETCAVAVAGCSAGTAAASKDDMHMHILWKASRLLLCRHASGIFLHNTAAAVTSQPCGAPAPHLAALLTLHGMHAIRLQGLLTMGWPDDVEGPVNEGRNMVMSPPREPRALSKALSIAFSSCPKKGSFRPRPRPYGVRDILGVGDLVGKGKKKRSKRLLVAV